MSDSLLNTFLRYGTAAARAAFTPDPPVVGGVAVPVVYIWYETDTGKSYLYDTSWHQISGAGVGGISQLTGDVTAGPGSGSQPATLANTAVTPGSYTNTNLTVNAKGLITAASTGSGGAGTVTHTAGNLTANELVVGNASADIKVVAATDGQIPIGKTSDGSVTLATITAGSNITVTNGAGSITIAAAAGASGNTISSTAIGSEPGSPATGDTDLYTNGMWAGRYSGSAWVPWGPLYPLTKPDDSGFSWVNQGSATTASTTGGVYFTCPKHSGIDIHLRVKSAPATPYVITAALLPLMMTAAYQDIGLCFRESGTGKLVLFRLDSDGFYITTASSPSALVANPFGVFTLRSSLVPTWMRIADDGTNHSFGLSADGQNFLTYYTVSRTSYLAGGSDQVGWFINDQTNTFPVAATLISWKVT